MCTVIGIYCCGDPALVAKLNNIYALYKTKLRNVWSNFVLLILYFDIFVGLQCIGSLMNAYPVDQS